MTKILEFKEVFDGEIIRKNIGIVIKGDTIIDLVPCSDPQDVLAAPGLIDIQINGGGGALFNQNPSEEIIKTISSAHLLKGTTGFFITLFSSSRETLKKAIKAYKESTAKNLLGLHLEGPYLHKEKKGVHKESYFRKFDSIDKELFQSIKTDLKIMTLAPEIQKDIKDLLKLGFVLMAGHSQATSEDYLSFIKAGGSGVTHIFNASSGLTARHPGLIGGGLTCDESYASVIADGHHLHQTALDIVFRCKPKDKIILTSDAMATSASQITSFSLDGEDVFVKKGACYRKDGTLAGAHFSLLECLQNAYQALSVSKETLLATATSNIARMFQTDSFGYLKKGSKANIVCLDPQTLALRGVVFEGKEI